MPETPQPGHLVGGRYRLETILGEGGMAVVWRSIHTETDRTVALKLVRPNLLDNDQARELFVKEARIAARIGRCENIVDVLDAGIDDKLGVPFLVMELLDGEALDAKLKRDGPIPRDLAADLVEQLGEALDQAHSAGVIHRDLKPQNLFLAQDRKGRTVLKVLDFGIAKLSETIQESATQIGTPAYSAPEQLGASWRAIAARSGGVIASQVSPGTDIWAFGLVTFEMITGAPSGSLWGATTLAELPVKMILEPTPSASERAGPRAQLLPPGFDAWLARCLALDSAQRWPAAGEAAKAVAGAMRSGVAAHPQNPSGPPVATPGYVPPVQTGFPQPPYPSSLPPQAAYTGPQLGPPMQGWQQPTSPPMQRAQSYPHMTPPPAAFVNTGMGYGAQVVAPQTLAWTQQRGGEARPAHLGELKSFEPWTFLPPVSRAGSEIFVPLDDGRLRIAEVYGGDMISQAMGEERNVLAILSAPRVWFRISIRSKASAGIADDIGRGLKLLDGLIGASSGVVKSIGDRAFEAHFDLNAPSAQEGHAGLPVPLRQLLVNGGFRGTIEMKPGIMAVSHHHVKSLDPTSLEFLFGFVQNAYRTLA